MLSPQAQRLRTALDRQGQHLPEGALEDVVARWNRGGQEGQPLAVLCGALRDHGLILSPGACAEVAWTLLGVDRPRSVRLGRGGSARLTHLVEWHDVALPSSARALGRQLRREPTLAPDLLRARPWLGDLSPQATLEAMFQSEWSGFLALLGEFGPWVYVPSVADLQVLSREYAALAGRAARARDADLLGAVLEQVRGHLPAAPPLLARLEATDHRPPPPTSAPLRAEPAAVADLARAEGTFWAAARGLAERRRGEWAARRGG